MRPPRHGRSVCGPRRVETFNTPLGRAACLNAVARERLVLVREFAWTLRATSMRPTADSGSPRSPVDRIGAARGWLLAGAPRP